MTFWCYHIPHNHFGAFIAVFLFYFDYILHWLHISLHLNVFMQSVKLSNNFSFYFCSLILLNFKFLRYHFTCFIKDPKILHFVTGHTLINTLPFPFMQSFQMYLHCTRVFQKNSTTFKIFLSDVIYLHASSLVLISL